MRRTTTSGQLLLTRLYVNHRRLGMMKSNGTSHAENHFTNAETAWNQCFEHLISRQAKNSTGDRSVLDQKCVELCRSWMSTSLLRDGTWRKMMSDSISQLDVFHYERIAHAISIKCERASAPLSHHHAYAYQFLWNDPRRCLIFITIEGCRS